MTIGDYNKEKERLGTSNHLLESVDQAVPKPGPEWSHFCL